MLHSIEEPSCTYQKRSFLKLLLLAGSVLLLAFLLAYFQENGKNTAQAQEESLTTPSSVYISAATESLTGTPQLSTDQVLLTPQPDSGPAVSTTPEIYSSGQGTLFLSLDEAGYQHIFAFQPQGLPFTRLTFGNWDDINPAVSPGGNRLAFASNRDGFWDLYLLDLTSGETKRITDTPEYDAAPCWSPDGRWLAYESYTSTEEGSGGGLDIFLLQLEGEADPQQSAIRLTEDPAADYSPAWSPGGRQIAFVSNRTGDDEIWLADLDQIEERFQNLSQSSQSSESHPAWSPDGNTLAWVSMQSGFQNLYVKEKNPAQSPAARYLGSGSWPVWSPDGKNIYSALQMPNQTYLTGYTIYSESLDSHNAFSTGFQAAGLAMPPLALNAALNGLTWGMANLPQPLPASLAQASSAAPEPAWQPVITPAAGLPANRQRLVQLQAVAASYPALQDAVDEAFIALRDQVAERAGWDFLATLENAYVPLTQPLFPGMQEDWLYTGRAFSLNPAPLRAGWLVVLKEDFGPDTYWRILIRTRSQDGSQGAPLNRLPWNFDARSGGDPRAYEQGGAPANSIPPGYWLDLTQLAASYGWERLPALSSWRSAYPAARFNEFVESGGKDWSSAMQEIYPIEALAVTPPVSTPSQ